jgi:hypothetical protein
MSSDSKTVTAAPDRQSLSFSNLRNFAMAAVAGLLLAVACASSAPPARTKPAPAPSPQKSQAPQATPAPTPEGPAPVPEPEERGSQAIVLDPGGEQEGSTRTLGEAARAARERRAHAAPSAIVINDKNLKQHATGQLTVATPGPKSGSAPEEPAQPLRDEQYWRSRALEIRLRWRHAADDIKELQESANGWRRSFYAEKDPNVRNARIKPEWDRVVDRLQEARAEVEASTQELAELLEEGRTAGALPGWLREGIDEEPQEEPEPSNIHKVIEPPNAGSGNQDGHGA